MLWGTTTVLEKLAIEHVRPPSGPLVALVGTTITVVLLTPNALAPLFRPDNSATRADTLKQPGLFGGLGVHRPALLAAAIIAGIAPLFGFTAIATGLVGYVTALFKLSAVFTVLAAYFFLDERGIRQRLFGASLMVVGGLLV